MPGMSTKARRPVTAFAVTGAIFISLQMAIFIHLLTRAVIMLNSEVVLALQAPSTTKCDFCQVSFCGINVQSRCIAVPLMQQHPHGLADIEDLIQSSDVYECFDGNTVEVEYMLDYLKAQSLTPRHVYREVRRIPSTTSSLASTHHLILSPRS
jgi:hypothetical protein